MELREIIRVIWKRLWEIVLGTLLFTALVFVVSLNIKPIYEARVLMVVEHTSSALSSDYTSLVTGADMALTYSTLLKTRPIMEIVIANLNLNLSPEYLSEEMVTTSLVPGTQLLELTVRANDACEASDIANEIAFTFISLRNTEQKLQNIQALEHDVLLQMETLKALISRNQSAVPNTNGSIFPAPDLVLVESTLSNQQLAYARLMETYLNIRLLQGQLFDMRIVEPAVPPKAPVQPNLPLYTFLGVCIGLTLSTALVFLVEYLDRSFKTAADVRQWLSLPTLGTIFKWRGRKHADGLVTLVFPDAPESETYRTLRANLRFASFDLPLRTLLVTSAVAQEGKTTVAANLGVVCAQAEIRVVLIDSDFRRPRLNQVFQLPNYTGLTDFLVGNVENIEACMLETGVDNLRLIPTGEIPPNPSELLGSERMAVALKEVEHYADLIIIDAPPVLVVSDALVLAPKVDGVLMVIEAGKTSFDVVRRACEAHQQIGARILGAVLTKVGFHPRDSHYYYTKKPRRLMRKADDASPRA